MVSRVIGNSSERPGEEPSGELDPYIVKDVKFSIKRHLDIILIFPNESPIINYHLINFLILKIYLYTYKRE